MATLVEAQAMHRVFVTLAPETRYRAGSTVHMGDAAMTEAGQMLHRQSNALIISSPDHVDAGGRDRSTDDHHRELPIQGGETRGR
jgi:hypothetical protein